MPINQATLRSLADRAGDETGECFPSAGRWIKGSRAALALMNQGAE